jgi:hypothetical protein
MRRIIVALAIIAVILLLGFLLLSKRDKVDPQVNTNNSSYQLHLIESPEKAEVKKPTDIKFKIVDGENNTFKDFAVAHEKLLHLIIIRKDLQHFMHVHPDFNQTTGEFNVKVTFPTDGPYRMFTDFTPAVGDSSQQAIALSQDVNIGSEANYRSQPFSIDTEATKKIENVYVDYFFGIDPKTGTQLDYSLTVYDPQSEEQLQLEPYLGAMGHSVIIREGSLDYVHVHAEGMSIDNMAGMSAAEHSEHLHGGEPDTMDFNAMFNQSGNYKIFTQFKLDDKVYTTDYGIKVN